MKFWARDGIRAGFKITIPNSTLIKTGGSFRRPHARMSAVQCEEEDGKTVLLYQLCRFRQTRLGAILSFSLRFSFLALNFKIILAVEVFGALWNFLWFTSGCCTMPNRRTMANLIIGP
jgi:hypothetical protein